MQLSCWHSGATVHSKPTTGFWLGLGSGAGPGLGSHVVGSVQGIYHI